MQDNMQSPSPSLMNNGPNSGNKVLNQAEGLARWVSRNLVVLTRKDFGERFFGASGFGKLVTYGILFAIAWNASQQLDTLPLGAFFFVSFLACLWHQWIIARRNRRGESMHSYYSGTPFLTRFLPLNEFTIKRWVEPLLWVGAGMVLLDFSPALAGWLAFSGTCLGATAALTAARERAKLLDLMDAQIEARQMRAVLIEQKPPTETEGFVIPVGKMKLQQRESIFNGLTSLYERAKEAIAKPQGGRCAACGAWNLADAGYCGNCGQLVAAAVAAMVTDASVPVAPRPQTIHQNPQIHITNIT